MSGRTNGSDCDTRVPGSAMGAETLFFGRKHPCYPLLPGSPISGTKTPFFSPSPASRHQYFLCTSLQQKRLGGALFGNISSFVSGFEAKTRFLDPGWAHTERGTNPPTTGQNCWPEPHPSVSEALCSAARGLFLVFFHFKHNLNTSIYLSC